MGGEGHSVSQEPGNGPRPHVGQGVGTYLVHSIPQRNMSVRFVDPILCSWALLLQCGPCRTGAGGLSLNFRRLGSHCGPGLLLSVTSEHSFETVLTATVF